MGRWWNWYKEGLLNGWMNGWMEERKGRVLESWVDGMIDEQR